MREFSATTALGRLLLRAGWAPAVVLVAHQIISRGAYRQQLDFLIHFCGGMAIAFFAYHALGCFAAWFGELRPLGRYLFSFAVACTVGLFWEFGELLSDVFLQTRIQRTIHETMRDLIADTTGALLSLGVVALVQLLRRKARA